MHRVVITGYGAVSALGATAEENWQSAVAGKSGVGPITLFDASQFPVQIAAEVKNFEPEKVLDRKELRRQDRFEQLAGVAAVEALHHSGLEVTPENSHRIGAIISTGAGGLETLIEEILKVTLEGPRKVSPFAIPKF